MPNHVLADRTVVISGGSRGIGLAHGIAAARCGPPPATGARMRTWRAVEAAMRRFGGIDVCVNNAGASVSRRARETTGTCHIDAEVLRSAGVADLSEYGGGEQPIPDIFLD